ncbi:stage III sporulation protein SpoIIIAB [Paenibacillus sp. N1-5-1-14]|nr:stage III sporulation protein SpoIIIAB [Paenibacillus radicibacter]MCR8642423.1 stage III sporulation protein SpoIIIAB [Paenibacillus radicibacter]
MAKMLGSVVILSAGTIFGFYQALQYARRPRQIRQAIGMIQRLETEISYGFTPLPDAFAHASSSFAEPYASMLAEAADGLHAPDGKSTQEIWGQAVKRAWGRSSMKRNELDILLQLGSTLGATDRIDQVKHMRLAISQLQVEEDIARDEQGRYEKMWRSLGVLMGALIVILMY